jgi:D-xylose transport system permease protein
MAGPDFTVAAPVVYLLLFTVAAWFVMERTVLGRRIQAVGGNAEAARLSGINVRAYRLGAFILSSLAAGFAGALFGSRLGAINPTAMQGAELTVIAAAILGGTSLYGGAGSVIKTVAGALILFTLTNGFNILNLGANYQGIIEGAVIIVAAAIYTLGNRKRGKHDDRNRPAHRGARIRAIRKRHCRPVRRFRAAQRRFRPDRTRRARSQHLAPQGHRARRPGARQL